MKPNEVRIDNCVMGYLDKKPVKVDWLVIKHLWDGNIQSLYDPKPVYEPIPLTPEILEKCGFEDDDSDFLKNINERTCIHINISLGRTVLESYDGIIIIPMCEYLHQLQNLFHALTGEELNYQP
ncbi:hypothetical protein Pan5_63 [Pseudanabaena phage Pan5]|nr:hypothetical protein Pan5_63 [Pseudanabaena phage Pan5]